MDEHATMDEPGGTILVPLDGSQGAERALPVAERFAKETRQSLLLVRVVPIITPANTLMASSGGVPAEVYQQLFDDERRAAEEYMRQQVAGAQGRGAAVRGQVMVGDPSSTLIDVAERMHTSLVVMTTHGRTGMERFALGSVADRMVCYGPAPVFLLRSHGVECRAERLDRAIIGLDGSERAERALDICRMLAGCVIRELVLVRAIAADADARKAAEAQQYLDEVVARHAHEFGSRDCGLTVEVLRGPAAEAILRKAERECDLIVIATHGRTGTARWALGSIAERVLHDAGVPVLLVRST